MRVEVEDIPSRGRVVAYGLDDPSLVAPVALALEATPTELSGELRLKRDGTGVRAFVRGRARVELPCARCGEPVDLVVEVDTRLGYRPTAEAPASGEVELSADDLDEGFFDGTGLEIGDILAEAFALAAPDRVTCAAAQGGISCELGRTETPADDVVGHPAFAVLRQLGKDRS
ncbi:MAG: DUF177 domain-containing protein [Alphaproteobacteria bacterium]|nr:DUF177 domain-containing protein [Alphaproteobacteria bacterium]